MTPYKRSTLSLDLKDFTTNPSTSALKHVGFACATGAVLLTAFILTNTPSASSTNNPSSDTGHTDALPVDDTSALTLDAFSHIQSPIGALVPHPPNNNRATSSEKEAERHGGFSFFAKTRHSADHSPPHFNEALGKKDEMSLASLELANRPLVQTNLEHSEDIGVSNDTVAADSDPAESAIDKGDHPLTSIEALPWRTAKVKKNDTLSQIFNRNNMPIREAYLVAKLEAAKPLLRIKPGEQIQFKRNHENQLLALRYKLGTFETLNIYKTTERFIAEIHTREPDVRINSAKATIWTSLLGAAENADISFDTMYAFIALFGWQVDFAKDIRSGDRFSIIFEELFLDGEKIDDGQIIAAELVTGDKKLRAIRYIDEKGNTEYYAPDGDGIKGSFLRTPLKFGRVTSKFSRNRLHPIKKTWRAHKGVDYGAPEGTPILATGDGVVKYSGRKGGYGKTIIVRHGGKYDTLYAHLSRTAKGIRKGSRVKQGQVIGYVGSTGLATGPHLHYEFRIHGVHKNPLTVVLPKSSPIDPKYKHEFVRLARSWTAELDNLNRFPLAQNQPQE